MNREKWKDLLEGIGGLATTASLVFFASGYRDDMNALIAEEYSGT